MENFTIKQSLLFSTILITNFIWHNSTICQQTVTDSGKLYPTLVKEVLYPTTIQEVQAIVKKAAQQNVSISIAGAKHSQGGHSNAQNSVQLDMKKLNKVLDLNTKNKTATVQAGASWQELQDFLQPHKLSVKVMQASNIFSIGGSISTNVHGRDPHVGPLIATIKSCKVVTPKGDLKIITPQQDKELFSLVIGGYGLFGIIVEATLSVTDNVMCSKKVITLKPSDYIAYFKKHVLTNSKIELHYGRLNTTPGKNFCDEILATSYKALSDPVSTTPLKKEKSIPFNQWLMKMYRTQWGKLTNYLKWMVEKYLKAPWENYKKTSRNQLMRPYIHSLENKDPQSSDLLQEYFIPMNQFLLFQEKLKRLSEQYKIKLLNVTLRYVPKNKQSFLTYSQHDCMAFVLYFTTQLDTASINNIKGYTQELIDACLRSDGTFYLPYQRFATKEQLLQAYPMLPTFIKLKEKYDPSNLFMNNWYQNYISKLLTDQ